MQELWVHEGAAGPVSVGFNTLRPSSYWFTKLMPNLAAGERIDIYAVPYEWGERGWATPNTAMATRAKAEGQHIYAFSYGACGALALNGEKEPDPPKTLHQVTITWPKSLWKGATYEVRISKAGNTNAFNAWIKAGKKQVQMFKGLAQGPYIVHIRAIKKNGVTSPKIKKAFNVTAQTPLSK